MSWESRQGDVWAWTPDGRYCANLSAWDRLLRNPVGPEPVGPESADAPHAPVVAMSVEPVWGVVGVAEAANRGPEFDELAERVTPEAESHHGTIIA